MLTYADPAAPAPGAALGRVRDAVTRGVTQRLWPWVRVFGGLGILGLLVWRFGAGGFLDALRVIDGGTLLAASGIGLLTTVLSAWRWCLVARGLGVRLPLAGATADYYRALFLNAALPGGILGDVHRAVRHGRNSGDLGRGVRAVVLERFAGQVVLVAVGVTVLLAFPTPVPSPGRLASLPPVLVAGLGLAGLGLAVFAGLRLRRSCSRWARASRTAVSAVRRGLLARDLWPGILASSVVVLAGYLTMFLVAARAAGITAPPTQLLPLLMLALFAMALPVNVGGWGPREGVCAWAFAAAGLGAAQGVTVAVVYGVSVFVASLPGAGVLVLRWFTDRRPAGELAGAGQPVPNRSERA